MEQSKEQNFAHYSIQFACLQKLRKNGLISVDEYEAIKKRLLIGIFTKVKTESYQNS